MGSFFDVISKTVEIDEQNTVTLRAPTYGELQILNSQSMVIQVGMDGKGAATFDAGLLERQTFHKCIVSWNGPGFDGLPVNPENIDRLPGFLMDTLKETMNELTSAQTPEKKVP